MFVSLAGASIFGRLFSYFLWVCDWGFIVMPVFVFTIFGILFICAFFVLSMRSSLLVEPFLKSKSVELKAAPWCFRVAVRCDLTWMF